MEGPEPQDNAANSRAAKDGEKPGERWHYRRLEGLAVGGLYIADIQAQYTDLFGDGTLFGVVLQWRCLGGSTPIECDVDRDVAGPDGEVPSTFGQHDVVSYDSNAEYQMWVEPVDADGQTRWYRVTVRAENGAAASAMQDVTCQ